MNDNSNVYARGAEHGTFPYSFSNKSAASQNIFIISLGDIKVMADY
jgi:hypothetical protein